MRAKRELIIGLMLEELSSDFSKELIQNVMRANSSNSGVRLAVIPGKYDDPHSDDPLHEYREVYNSIFALGGHCGIDGMIFHLGSISSPGGSKLYDRCVEMFSDVPKVFIGLDDPELVTVNYDNEAGIREAVNYLVNVSGFTRLCMMGGREDNKDARLRKKIFIRCLEENGIRFDDSMFVNTDMSSVCYDRAGQLLDHNPDAQAVFCVNDATAKALYRVMEERELTPGSDIMVFAFDNTNMSGELIPSLSSIGSCGTSLGEKALEMVLDMINGGHPEPALVPTKLYGRSSLPYAMYDFSRLEMVNVDTSFVYRLFDDCFYRYKTSGRGREEIDLRRLTYEIISKMLYSIKFRYMSIETYDELCRLIDILFDNSAMRYTDAAKLLRSFDRLQMEVNELQRSAAASRQINRLFLRMRDKAVLALANDLAEERKERFEETRLLEFFLADSMACRREEGRICEKMIRSLERFCLKNAALYMYGQPVRYTGEDFDGFPQQISLECIIRDGSIHIIPDNRRQCRISDVFSKSELPSKCSGFVAFPIFHRDILYGLLLCEPDGDIYDRGATIALQIGRVIYMNRNE